jgi:hypothetical protein
MVPKARRSNSKMPLTNNLLIHSFPKNFLSSWNKPGIPPAGDLGRGPRHRCNDVPEKMACQTAQPPGKIAHRQVTEKLELASLKATLPQPDRPRPGNYA